MLANGIEEVSLLLVVLLSLAVTYAVVFVAGFSDQDRRRNQSGLLQHPLSETAAAYVVSLAVSFIMLMLFGNVALGDPLPITLERVVVLSLPASIGGAAGRLVV